MMVTFYILSTAHETDRLLFICRLLEHCYANAPLTVVETTTQHTAEQLNQLLWTYRDDSFLPHAIYGELPILQATTIDQPMLTTPIMPFIYLIYTEPPMVDPTRLSHLAIDKLINLSLTMPMLYTACKEIIEIVYEEPHAKQLARQRFRQYRKQHCDLKTITVSSPLHYAYS